jgi:hypothetical protein
MEKEFIPYKQSLELKELGFDELCMYAWCITVEHRVEYDGKMSLKTDGNPFGQFYKGKSFNGNYNPNKNKIQCSAPTYSQAFRWFREKYNLASHIATYWQHDWNNYSYQYYFTEDKIVWNGIEHYKTYEEAETACLKKLIEIVKEK